MKSLRYFLVAVVLTFGFAAHTFAGQMDTLMATPTPTPPPSTGQMTTWSAEPSPATDGQMDTLFADQIQTGRSDTVDPVTGAAIDLLQSMLPLF